MPNLEMLNIGSNLIGNQGLAALAAPLRKLPTLEKLQIYECGIGHEGLASLVANLGKDDFKKLKKLDLDLNEMTDKGCATLVSALDEASMPNLTRLLAYTKKKFSEAAAQALRAAADRRGISMMDIDDDVSHISGHGKEEDPDVGQDL